MYVVGTTKRRVYFTKRRIATKCLRVFCVVFFYDFISLHSLHLKEPVAGQHNNNHCLRFICELLSARSSN